MFGVVPRLQSLTAEAVSGSAMLKGFVEHPAGPFTIHFWAPTAKWMISAANIADLSRPVEKMSANQQSGAREVLRRVIARSRREKGPLD